MVRVDGDRSQLAGLCDVETLFRIGIVGIDRQSAVERDDGFIILLVFQKLFAVGHELMKFLLALLLGEFVAFLSEFLRLFFETAFLVRPLLFAFLVAAGNDCRARPH